MTEGSPFGGGGYGHIPVQWTRTQTQVYSVGEDGVPLRERVWSSNPAFPDIYNSPRRLSVNTSGDGLAYGIWRAYYVKVYTGFGDLNQMNYWGWPAIQNGWLQYERTGFIFRLSGGVGHYLDFLSIWSMGWYGNKTALTDYDSQANGKITDGRTRDTRLSTAYTEVSLEDLCSTSSTEVL